MKVDSDPNDGETAASEIRRLEARFAVLSASTRAFAEATVDYGRLLDTITERLAEVVQDCCALSMVSDDERSLQPVSIHANHKNLGDQLRSLRDAAPVRLDEQTLTQQVFLTGVAALIPTLDLGQLRHSTPPVYLAFLTKLRVHSVLIVALRVQGRSLGVLTLLRNRPESPPFDDRDRELAQLLADHAALALSNSRLITARNNAEARFERLSEAGVLGVMVCEMTGRIVEMNDTLLHLLGYSREEVLSGGLSWISMTPAIWSAIDAHALDELRRTGLSSLREKEYLRKDGTRIPVMVGSAMLDDGASRAISFVLDLSGRKRAEAAAHAEQARFRALIEKSADGIVLSSAEGKFLYLTPAAATMLGRTADEVIGTSFRDYIHADDLEAAADQRRRVLASTGHSEPVVRRVVRRDGTVRWVEVTATNLLGDPAVGAIVSNIRDITDRKHVEDALRVAQHRFTALFESGIIGILVADEAGSIVDANETFLSMLGYTRDDLVAGRMDWRRLTPPEWATWNAETAAELRRHGHANPREREYFRKDGTRVPVLVGIAKAEGPYVISVSLDVTERKRVDKALVERMQLATSRAAVMAALAERGTLREMLQQVAAAIVEHLGASHVRIWIVDTAKTSLRLEASAGIYPPPDEVDASIPVGNGRIGRIAQERRAYTTQDLEADAPTDDLRWARCGGNATFAGYPLLARGELVGVLAACARSQQTDVMLAHLASIATTLAVAIDPHLSERSKINLELQLRQMQKMEAVGRLAGGVAHDFNNILSVILSYGDFLLEDLDHGVPNRDDLIELLKAANRAATLTRQLLLFSRQQVIEPKVVDLNALLMSMDNMLRRIVGEDVELRSLTNQPVGGVLADPGSMEQVVMNLVVNARDAMPVGGKLTIETANVDLDDAYACEHVGVKPGPHVMLAVSDTGVGMDDATVARVFEPFFTTKEMGKGTGLGLSTVFGIVMQSSGSVWVDSEPGRGTTFKMYLPRVDAGVENAVELATPPTLRGSETILLVEDEEQVRTVAHGILVRYGYEVLVARDVGEALEICARHPSAIDLLLSDVVMPTMSGPELARRLSVVRPSMRVLCMSGYTDDSVVHHGVLESHFAFLQKPFTSETLTRKVRETIDALGRGLAGT